MPFVENIPDVAAAAAGAAGIAGGIHSIKKMYNRVRSTGRLNPQHLHKKRKVLKKIVAGQQSLEPHAEIVESPLKSRMNLSLPQDITHQFLKNISSARNFNSQFAFQCCGEQQVRGIFSLIFRHNAGEAEQSGFGSGVTTNGRLLLAKPTYKQPEVGDIVTPGRQQTNLPYNYLWWRDNTHDIGKAFVAGTSMGDFEDMISQITPPFMQPFDASYFYIGNAPSNSGAFKTANDDGGISNPVVPYTTQTGSNNRANGKWVEGYKKAREDLTHFPWENSRPQRPPKRMICFRDGGVNLHFENKHAKGSYVEVIMYKIKKTALATTHIQAEASPNVSDNLMSKLFDECGKNYLNSVASEAYYQGAETLEGRVPHKTDCTTNPYFPLLPKGGESDTFSEKERINFAIASGHKRTVQLKFGGLCYDPADQSTRTAILQNTVDGNPYTLPQHSHAVMVVVAINGQLVSVAATALGSGEQLTSGDAACGTNMIIKADYYEQFYPMKTVMPTRYDALGQMDYSMPTSTGNVSYDPYTIIDASNVIRGVSADASSGHKINPHNNVTDEM